MLEAEETESSLHRDLRVAEQAVADRDDLEAHCAALKDRLEETRAEQGQLANYKQASFVSPSKKLGFSTHVTRFELAQVSLLAFEASAVTTWLHMHNA